MVGVQLPSTFPPKGAAAPQASGCRREAFWLLYRPHLLGAALAEAAADEGDPQPSRQRGDAQAQGALLPEAGGRGPRDVLLASLLGIEGPLL